MAEVFWSEKAKQDFWKNIEYLEIHWTANEVSRFVNEVNKVIELLINQNITFVATNYRNTFKVTITKQISLFYKIDDLNNVVLLRFWNNLQDPKKLKI